MRLLNNIIKFTGVCLAIVSMNVFSESGNLLEKELSERQFKKLQAEVVEEFESKFKEVNDLEGLWQLVPFKAGALLHAFDSADDKGRRYAPSLAAFREAPDFDQEKLQGLFDDLEDDPSYRNLMANYQKLNSLMLLHDKIVGYESEKDYVKQEDGAFKKRMSATFQEKDGEKYYKNSYKIASQFNKWYKVLNGAVYLLLAERKVLEGELADVSWVDEDTKQEFENKESRLYKQLQMNDFFAAYDVQDIALVPAVQAEQVKRQTTNRAVLPANSEQNRKRKADPEWGEGSGTSTSKVVVAEKEIKQQVYDVSNIEFMLITEAMQADKNLNWNNITRESWSNDEVQSWVEHMVDDSIEKISAECESSETSKEDRVNTLCQTWDIGKVRHIIFDQILMLD